MPSLSSPLLNHNLAANVNVTTNNYDPSSYASAVESSATATAIGRGRGRSGSGTAGTASTSATTMMQDNEICSGTTDINLMSRKRTTYDINDTGILLLPGTTSNMILIERFLFWQIIWNKLHALGWILETQGNQLRDDFYFFPPHAIKTTTISDDGRNGSSRRSLSSNLKPNIDFFDDELRIMHCLITDSRYTLLEPKISMICNEYKEYLFQLKVLQSLKSSEDDASRIHINHIFPQSIYTPNKQMIDYIQNRVQIRLLSLSNATTSCGGHSPSSITRGTPNTTTGATASTSALSDSKMMIMTTKRRSIEEEAANSMRMKIKMNDMRQTTMIAANADANANANNVHNNNRPQQNHHQMLSHHHPRHHNYNNINNAVLQNHHYHLLQQQQQLHQQQQQHNEQQQRLLLQEIARRNRMTTTTTPTATAPASDNRDTTAAAMGTSHIASSIAVLTRNNDREAKGKAKAKSDNGGNNKAGRTAITNDDIRKLDVLCDDASFISKKPPIIGNKESAAIDNDNNNSSSNNNKSDDEKNLLLSKNCGNIIYLELIGDTIEEYCTYEQDAKERTEICLELVRNVTSNCGRFLARKEVGSSGSGNSGENGRTTNKNNQVVEDDDDDDETNNNNTNNSGDTESLWYELEEEQAVFITKLDLEELEITKDVTSNSTNKKKKTPTTASSPALSSINENNAKKGNRTPPPPPEAASTATNADAGYGRLKRRISSVSSMSSTPSSYSTTSKAKRTSNCGSPTLSSSSDYATAVARISSSCGNSGSESVRAKYIRQKAVKDVKMEERRRKPLLKRNLMTKCIPTLSRFPLDDPTVNQDRAAADVPEFNTLRNFSSHTGIPVGNNDDGIIRPPADDEPTSYNTSSTACNENEKAIDKIQKQPSSVDEKLDAYYSKHPNKNKHVRFCVMCGERRQCNRSSNEYRKGDIFIPNQNRGVCSWCDTNVVWNVITPAPPATTTTNESTISLQTTTPTVPVDETTLELKWCKGCKNFRCWTAFCNNGMATKCDPCREKQSLKYLQKVYTKDLDSAERAGNNIIAMNSMNTNHMNYNHIP